MHVNVIDEIFHLDEQTEMIAAFDVREICERAAYYFQTSLICDQNKIVLPSSTKKNGWILEVGTCYLELTDEHDNPWFDFLKRRYSRWIPIYQK